MEKLLESQAPASNSSSAATSSSSSCFIFLPSPHPPLVKKTLKHLELPKKHLKVYIYIYILEKPENLDSPSSYQIVIILNFGLFDFGY